MKAENLNSSNVELESIDEKWEDLVRRAQAAENEYAGRNDKNTNYSRVIGNLLTPANPHVLGEYIGDEGAYEDAMRSLDYYDRYMSLIKDFPDFAEKELSSPEGMFPNIDGFGNTNSYAVVDLIEQKLRGQEEVE